MAVSFMIKGASFTKYIGSVHGPSFEFSTLPAKTSKSGNVYTFTPDDTEEIVISGGNLTFDATVTDNYFIADLYVDEDNSLPMMGLATSPNISTTTGQSVIMLARNYLNEYEVFDTSQEVISTGVYGSNGDKTRIRKSSTDWIIESSADNGTNWSTIYSFAHSAGPSGDTLYPFLRTKFSAGSLVRIENPDLYYKV